jgi:hypothetical protein
MGRLSAHVDKLSAHACDVSEIVEIASGFLPLPGIAPHEKVCIDKKLGRDLRLFSRQ